VLEFDNDGQLLRRWGGPGDGYDWPEREHGIWVDAQGYVWISGNGGWPRPAEGGSTDDMILKFTGDGELVMQIGQRGASQGNVDTVDVHQPGDVFVHEPTNELYVADGYGNRRIQWFTMDGTYLSQLVIEGDAPAAPAGFAFSPDAEQRLLYVVESANARVLIYDRRSMTQIGVFGSRSAAPGGMDIAHHIAVDSQGNLYTAEIVNNRRAQKFVGR
jgi:DNA-binding beta-propeller fold protein YncE